MVNDHLSWSIQINFQPIADLWILLVISALDMNVMLGCKNTHRVNLLWCKLVSTCKFRSSSYYLSLWEIQIFSSNGISDHQHLIHSCFSFHSSLQVSTNFLYSFLTTKRFEKDRPSCKIGLYVIIILLMYWGYYCTSICPINQPPDKNM